MEALETVKCSVCEKEFSPDDDHDFFCKGCQNRLTCSCGSDDVMIIWVVDVMSKDYPFYVLRVVCSGCGEEMEAYAENLDEFDDKAREVFKKWIGAVVIKLDDKGAPV